jgi:hypothetical protein
MVQQQAEAHSRIDVARAHIYAWRGWRAWNLSIFTNGSTIIEPWCSEPSS